MSIIDAAFDLGLPVIEDEMLQRLLSGVDIGEEIPESLYRAVAVVLARVFCREEMSPAANRDSEGSTHVTPRSGDPSFVRA